MSSKYEERTLHLFVNKLFFSFNFRETRDEGRKKGRHTWLKNSVREIALQTDAIRTRAKRYEAQYKLNPNARNADYIKCSLWIEENHCRFDHSVRVCVSKIVLVFASFS